MRTACWERLKQKLELTVREARVQEESVWTVAITSMVNAEVKMKTALWANILGAATKTSSTMRSYWHTTTCMAHRY